MEGQTITKLDLEVLRSQLIDDFKAILLNKSDSLEQDWLRSLEVRKILKISPGSLQNLRISGKLTFTKISGLYYYSRKSITDLLEAK